MASRRSSLLERLKADAAKRKPVCRVCSLPARVLQEVTQAYLVDGYSGPSIARLLQEDGHDIKEERLRRHFRDHAGIVGKRPS